ncbi:TetR/AcrR family transcriptional regulator [Methylobacterium sp. J-030]|uniref:TetR/AcrR family transcriptional regulator n=1 Tax=Methylobacterium sp. J-030 TaxID=2836627 RepID=UPI001FBA9351|nr:TetR/AcrR family transcriptional regulator [Methylobacterium sp. J-030]MCJ2069859.1 TetR/AcrR family transcriptional regulator [Methylobacterium sp. J-030]
MSTSDPDRRYHHGDLRASLVAAALAQLEVGGAAALSLRGAARTCGVSAMAPYRHFSGKEELLEAVAASGFEDLAVALEAADASADGAQALAAQGAAYVTFACRQPALFRLMFMGPGCGPDRSRAYAILERRAATLAGSRMAVADLTLAAWSLVHGLAALILDRRVPLAGEAAEDAARRITLAFARLAAEAR